MNWRDLLARIWHPSVPPADTAALIEASADRAGVVNRRAFLQLAGAAVAGLALDPERLLWMPGEKTIYLFGDASSEGTSIDWITREALRLLEKNLAFAGSVNRQYDELFVVSGGKGYVYDINTPARIGDTVRVRPPVQFKSRPQPVVPRTVPVTLTGQLSVACESRVSEPVSVKRQLTPMMADLAQRVKRENLNVFGTLNCPPGVEEAAVVTAPSGLALRGIRSGYLDFGTGKWTSGLRFDLLGGTLKGRHANV